MKNPKKSAGPEKSSQPEVSSQPEILPEAEISFQPEILPETEKLSPERVYKRMLRALLPHAVVIFALTGLTLVILTLYNPRMGFMTGTPARIVFAALAVLSLISSVMEILRR